jgi:type IX secretion system PorP/SprF family membrane protein
MYMKHIYTIWLKRFLPMVILVALAVGLNAQDLHFSMFQNQPLNHNPGLTGVFNGDQRYAASYRRQWFEVPVEYMTFAGRYDRNFLRDGAKNFFSGGILFNYDEAGKSKLSSAFLGVSGSYTHALSPKALVTGGVIIGGGQKSVTTQGLLFGGHWDGEKVNIALGSGEPAFDETHFYFDVGAGANLRLQKSARTRLDIGGAAFHLTQPNISFYEKRGDANTYIRVAAQAYGSIEVLPQLDIQGNFLAQFAGPNQEIVVGGMLNIHVSTKKTREVQFAVGLGVRLNDALIPQVALSYDGWRAGFSYDINTSQFDVATNEKGGPEFSLIYTITQVRALEQSKLCKIF